MNLFTHLLLCPSHRILPALNIVLLLTCAVNVWRVAPDSDMIRRHARGNTDIDSDTLHVLTYT
jgi:hypothetical protein